MTPPLVGEALKVTLAPTQLACAPAVIEMLTIGVKFGFTVTVVAAGADMPHLLATTLTVATPVNEAFHITVPVVPVPEMVFPAPVTLHV